MRIKDFVEKNINDNLEYAVLKNWHQPTPEQQKFKEFYDVENQGGRISIKNKILYDEFKYFLEESLLAYPNKEYDYFLMEARSFRNVNSNSGTDEHVDPHDILHWQCRGATYWFIGKNSEQIMLEPGDLIWFRANTKHRTENITEKYSLIFNAGIIEKY